MSATSPPDPKRAAERRTYWIAGIVLFGSIAVMTTITLFTSPSVGPRKDTQGQLQEQGGPKPHIIPRPGDGHAPEHPNDRGGWQQFMALGLIVAAVGTIGGLAWRSSRRARSRRVAGVSSGVSPGPPTRRVNSRVTRAPTARQPTRSRPS